MFSLIWLFLVLFEAALLNGKSLPLEKRPSNHVKNTIPTNEIHKKTLSGSSLSKKTLSKPLSKNSEDVILETKGKNKVSLKEKAFNALFVRKRTNDGSKRRSYGTRNQPLGRTPTSQGAKLRHISKETSSVRNASKLKHDNQTYLKNVTKTFKQGSVRNVTGLKNNIRTHFVRNVTRTSTNDTLEKRECCHYWDHGHDLMELHNNPHHYGTDFMHGPAHDEVHSIDEHGERLDLGDEDLGGGGGGHHGHGLYEGGGAGYTNSMYGGGGGGGGEGGWGGGGGGGGWGGGYGGTTGVENYNPHTHYNSYHNEPHYHHQDVYNEPHYHEHHHHYNPTFEHNDYHYIDDHHEHFHHQPHYVNNEVHIHHEENNDHDDALEHYGSGHHSDYGHGGYHHVKVNLHGPGKSPEQWHHQEQHEMSHMGGEDNEQLNNYDTGAGFFQLDEHGGEVDITSLHHGGTKVHMGGGHFSVVRDPWRFHSAFAGLLQPHESIANSVAAGGGGGYGGGGIQQFHQHFTYINNERNEKTKVQNLVHHQHEGEVGSEEHHFSEHHDDHHLHHEHEHVGHHDDVGGDHHDDHGSHHHHHEEDEAHHHYEEHHQDALHSPDGGGGYGHGGGGSWAGTGGGSMGGGGGMAYTRHNMNYRDGGEYDVKPFPGNVLRGAEQFKGTPEDDNYRQDRAPAMVGVKRSVKQITPLAAFVGYTGIKRELGSKENNRTNELTVDDHENNDELSLDKKTMGSIADEMRLENETMQNDLSSLEGGQSRDVVRKVFFNSLVKHESNDDDDSDPDSIDDVNEKKKDDELLKDYVPEGSGSGSGSGEAEKRSVTGNVRGGTGGGEQEISGNNPLEDSVIHGPEAGISRVFIEPMIVKKRSHVYSEHNDGKNSGDKSLLRNRLKLFRKAVFTGDSDE